MRGGSWKRPRRRPFAVRRQPRCNSSWPACFARARALVLPREGRFTESRSHSRRWWGVVVVGLLLFVGSILLLGPDPALHSPEAARVRTAVAVPFDTGR